MILTTWQKEIICDDVIQSLKKWKSEYRSAIVDFTEKSIVAKTIMRSEISQREIILNKLRKAKK
jgi:hypothetical protein